MFSSDSFFDSPDITNEMNTSSASFDLNEDGIDETFTQSFDRDGDSKYDASIVRYDSDSDGIAETTAFFDDRDVNGDGISCCAFKLH